ncbi:unnamed protein product [Amoebophrya sp. A25]|nr:unnamed protein product [Amoebophrya sp. A25]|eukprot:GSA25T00013306001.1
MLVWDNARGCDANGPDGAGLLQEEVARKVSESFAPQWVDSTLTLVHKVGNSKKSFMVGNHFNGIGHPLNEKPAADTLLRVGVQSDFLMSGLVLGVWTTPGKQARVGIPIASPIDSDQGFMELLSCETCMVQIIYVPFQNVQTEKKYCAKYSLDIANVALSAPQCNLLAPELPVDVTYTTGGGPAFLDGDFYIGGSGRDPVEAIINVPAGHMDHGILVAHGVADGHRVTFERSLPDGSFADEKGSDEDSVTSAPFTGGIGKLLTGGREVVSSSAASRDRQAEREQLFSLWSQSGGGRLRIRLRPEVASLSANCLNLNLHVFAAKLEMLPICPWRDVTIGSAAGKTMASLMSAMNGQASNTPPPTKGTEMNKFSLGIQQALAQIRPLSEGIPVDISHLNAPELAGEQLDGSTANSHILRHIIRASLSIDLVAGFAQEDMLRETFSVKNPQGLRLRLELSLDPPIVPVEMIIEDENGQEFDRAKRIRGRRLLFTDEALPEGTYYFVLRTPTVPQILRKPPDGFGDVVVSGAYCLDAALTVVAEPGGPLDAWRQEVAAYPELFAIEKLEGYRVHADRYKEMTFSVPLHVKHTGSTLTITKSFARSIRLQSEPINLKFGKLMIMSPDTNAVQEFMPHVFLHLKDNSDTKLKIFFDCSPSETAAACMEQPFLLTIGIAAGHEDDNVEPYACPSSLAVMNLWQPLMAQQWAQLIGNSRRGRSSSAPPPYNVAGGSSIGVTSDASNDAADSLIMSCVSSSIFDSKDALVDSEREHFAQAWDIEVAGPSVVKLSFWARNFARYATKLGLVTLEGVWMAEAHGSNANLNLELPGPAQYKVRLTLSEAPRNLPADVEASTASLASLSSTSAGQMLGHMEIRIVPLGDELRLAALAAPLGGANAADPFRNSNVMPPSQTGQALVASSASKEAGANVGVMPLIDVSAARDLHPRSKCHFQAATLLPMDFFSSHGGSAPLHGPLRAEHFPSPPLFHADVLLTDLHDGRKKVFVQLPDSLQTGQWFSPQSGMSDGGGLAKVEAYSFQLKLGGDFQDGAEVGFRVESNGIPLVPLWSSRDSKVYEGLQPKQKLWLAFHRIHRVRGLSACRRFHFFLALSAVSTSSSSSLAAEAPKPGGGLLLSAVQSAPAACPVGSRGAALLEKATTRINGAEQIGDSVFSSLPEHKEGAALLPSTALAEALFDSNGRTPEAVLMRDTERRKLQSDFPTKVPWRDLEGKVITLSGTTAVRRLKLEFSEQDLARWRSIAEQQIATSSSSSSSSGLLRSSSETSRGKKIYVQLRIVHSYLSGSPSLEAGLGSTARWAVQESDDSIPGLDMARVLVVELDEVLRLSWFFWWESNFPDECGVFSFQARLLFATGSPTSSPGGLQQQIPASSSSAGTVMSPGMVSRETRSPPTIAVGAGVASSTPETNAAPLNKVNLNIVFPLSRVVRANAVKTEYSVLAVGRPQVVQPKPHLVENPVGDFHIVTWRREPSERMQDFRIYLDGDEVIWKQRMDSLVPGLETSSGSVVGGLSSVIATASPDMTARRNLLLTTSTPSASTTASAAADGAGPRGKQEHSLLGKAGREYYDRGSIPSAFDGLRQIAVFLVILVVFYMVLKIYVDTQRVQKAIGSDDEDSNSVEMTHWASALPGPAGYLVASLSSPRGTRSTTARPRGGKPLTLLERGDGIHAYTSYTGDATTPGTRHQDDIPSRGLTNDLVESVGGGGGTRRIGSSSCSTSAKNSEILHLTSEDLVHFAGGKGGSDGASSTRRDDGYTPSRAPGAQSSSSSSMANNYGTTNARSYNSSRSEYREQDAMSQFLGEQYSSSSRPRSQSIDDPLAPTTAALSPGGGGHARRETISPTLSDDFDFMQLPPPPAPLSLLPSPSSVGHPILSGPGGGGAAA